MHRRMREWYLGPQVTVAFQYTLREDDRFPYGLIATGLEAAYPALGLWQAWAAPRGPRRTRPHRGSPTPGASRRRPDSCIQRYRVS
jgi:hypothetical protein